MADTEVQNMTTATHDAKASLEEHAKSIDALYDKLAAMPGVAKDRLKDAVDRYKKAHQTFCDDAMEYMH
jgi:hypothetical protein